MTLIFNQPLILGKKVLYKPDDFTVVGSPVITENGILSDGNGANYVKCDYITNQLLNKSWRIEQLYKPNGIPRGVLWSFGEDIWADTCSNLSGAYNHLYLSLRTGDSNEWKNNYNVRYIDIPTVYQNEWIKIVSEFNINTGEYKVTASYRNWSTSMTYTPATTNKQIYAITTLNKQLIIGGGVSGAVPYGNVEIDLKSVKIYAENELVFKGSNTLKPKWELTWVDIDN